jgi:hypothetical protein
LNNLQTRVLSSTDHKFMKFQYFRFILSWYLLCNSSVSMHA